MKIISPAGAGKTHALLEVVERFLAQGMSPDKIVFTTFSKAGAGEAVQRASQKFGFSYQQLPFFRTLHSICYRFAGGRRVLGGRDMAAFARIIGVPFTLKQSLDGRGAVMKGDHLLATMNLARARLCSLKEAYERYEDNHMFQYEELAHFAASYEQFKDQRDKIDYTDMLEIFEQEKPRLMIDAVVVDEAQDLSRLQWRCIDILSQNAQHLYVAGDDDQCIHEWAGADPDYLIDMDAVIQPLTQSYRIPQAVHRLANQIVSKISKRLPKEYTVKPVEGKVIKDAKLELLDLSSGRWMFLVRNVSFMDQIIQFCEEQGHLYTCTHTEKGILLSETLNLIRQWEFLRSGGDLPASVVKDLYLKMSQRDRVTRGMKKVVAALPDDLTLKLKDLVENYGLLTDAAWYTALDMLDPAMVAYLRACERKEDLHKGARIEVTTIHGSKGRGCQNVVICHDMTYKTHKGFIDNPDREHRVAYVAVTRTEESLYILSPSTNMHYEY